MSNLGGCQAGLSLQHGFRAGQLILQGLDPDVQIQHLTEVASIHQSN